MDATAVLAHAKSILVKTAERVERSMAQEDPRAAKRHVSIGQRQLRDLKRQVRAGEQETRASFQQVRRQIDQRGQALGLFTGARMRGAMARGRAADKRRLAAEQAQALAPYRHLKTAIDDLVAYLATMRSDIDAAVARARTASLSNLPPKGWP